MKKAQELFEIYCAICHGNAGDGKGKLVKNEKFLEFLTIKIDKLQKVVFST
jgi:cytochrome c